MADAATDNVTPRALRTRGVGASRAMPISQSVRPTATVQVMCTEGTLAWESKPDKGRNSSHEQTQKKQTRANTATATQTASDCLSVTLSVCHSVSVFLQSAADDRSRWKRPSTPAPHNTGTLPGLWTSHHPRLYAAAAAAHLHARPRPTRPCAQPQPDGDGPTTPTTPTRSRRTIRPSVRC